MVATQTGLFALTDREVAGTLLSVAAGASSVKDQERRAVAQAREKGWSWDRIAAHLEVNGETMRRRYGSAETAQAGDGG